MVFRFFAAAKQIYSIVTVFRAAPVLFFTYSDGSNSPKRLKDLRPASALAARQQHQEKFPPPDWFIALNPPFDIMPDAQLPARPGNLTPEQEAKLKELWILVHKTFGVSPPPALLESSKLSVSTSIISTNGISAPSEPAEEDGVDQKKKKRLGFLRKKEKKDDKEKSSTKSGSTIGIDDDDKYGQTKQFKTAISEMTPDELRVAFWSMVKADHPDGLLLRFLRARKWDVKKALVMMISTMHWRLKEMNVESIVFKGEGAAIAEHDEGFMKQIRLGKSYLHGTDISGRPICTVRARLHKQGDQSEDALNRYTIYVMETARMCLKDPVDTATVIFDLSDFSLANMDYAPVKFMIKCFEAHYPESLGICLVYKAPWIFQGIWNIIKGWLDPVVASKIHFARSPDDLAKFLPKEKIWKELGGTNDWEYKYIEPVAGEDDLLNDSETREKLLEEREKIVREYEDATWSWIFSTSSEFRNARNEIAKRLREDYVNIDPYLRAKTVYDRVGYINLQK
ncbi:CRAL-TRIO domain-containing protein [Lipomyces japonicus]|uniref:CRAL-TRIO domain-containing protein n=1 Tax=Lipomyces japonicus TaxID=56871 RepID=UPI0034CD2AE9